MWAKLNVFRGNNHKLSKTQPNLKKTTYKAQSQFS